MASSIVTIHGFWFRKRVVFWGIKRTFLKAVKVVCVVCVVGVVGVVDVVDDVVLDTGLFFLDMRNSESKICFKMKI